jgi:UDP-glucose 4-epimerase
VKVLVTGGAGFIGSHVVEHLLRLGHRVTVVDNLSTGSRDHVPARVSLRRVDVADREFRTIAQTERPHVVLHLAAQPSVRRSIDDPPADARTNVIGSINVVRAAVECRARRIVLASSGGAIYGTQHRVPTPETAVPAPLSPYAAGKFSMEVYARCLTQSTSTAVTLLRLANVYGPRQDPRGEAGVIAIFTSLMLAQRTPTIFGDGRQTRDFVFVDDVASAFVQALSGAPGTYNIGTGIETSVLSLFDRISSITAYERKPRFAPPLPGEVHRSAVDARLAARRLRWRPMTRLDEGLLRTVAWHRTAGR